ncbi:MAG: Tim44/TimA family putative adaptor protein [Pseudomonadota bacterium]
MPGNFDLLTIISLVVAVLAIIKLRSVLGKRTSDDEARIDRQMRAREAQQRAAAAGEKVVTLPGREPTAMAGNDGDDESRREAEERIQDYAKSDKELENGLLVVFRTDPSFEPETFMSGAKQAYEMIVTAFAEGNKRLLRDLLSSDVYDGFAAAIDEREQQGLQVDQSFVGINSARIIEAELKAERNAHVTVRFVSQLISATRDKTGEVVSGDPEQIMEVTDIWTFARDVTSNDPNWKLIGTQSPS